MQFLIMPRHSPDTQPLLPFALSHPEGPTHSLLAAFPTTYQTSCPGQCTALVSLLLSSLIAQDDPASAVFSSYRCPTMVYTAGLLWKLHGQFFKHYRKNRTHAASLGLQSHMPSTLENPSALLGSLCMPGAWRTGRGVPGLANIFLYALQLDPCLSHGQELLPVQGAQGGCWLGG